MSGLVQSDSGAFNTITDRAGTGPDNHPQGLTTTTVVATGAVTGASFSQSGTVSLVRLHTSNGYGSTNNKIRRMSTTVTNTGSDITYADSATAGGSFTINTTGIYSISYADIAGAAASFGLSLNSSQLTTSIASITTADRLIMFVASATDFVAAAPWTGKLTSGDVVRIHTDGSAASSAPDQATVTIVKII